MELKKTPKTTTEIRTHKRLIDILDRPRRPSTRSLRLQLPSGVDIEIKL